MGDPHRKERYGQTWDESRIAVYLSDLEEVKPYVVLSGGWAWHFLSPEGHTELRHAHDHKDVDIHVPPPLVGRVIGMFMAKGYSKSRTQWDNHPRTKASGFRRYERIAKDSRGRQFKVTIDFFVAEVREIKVRGWRIMDPLSLLLLYGDIHSSDKCFAVPAARRLLAAGEDIVGHPDLVAIPEETQ